MKWLTLAILAFIVMVALILPSAPAVANEEPSDPADACACCGNYNLPPCCIRCAMDLWWLDLDGNWWWN